MGRIIGLILGVVISLIIFINPGLVFSQGDIVKDTQVTETQTEPDMQWFWGEVVSVDMQKNEFVIKSPDYETDQEKQMTIIVDDKTVYENIESILELKPNATVSVDYTVSPEGKNIAKNISVEKPENSRSIPQEATPEKSEAATEVAPGQ